MSRDLPKRRAPKEYPLIESVEFDSTKYQAPFYCRTAGDPATPTLVLMHGHMANSTAFRRVWGRLATRYHLLIPDLPGHGADRSFRSLNLPAKIDAVADWLFDLLVANNLALGRPANHPVHLVAHSLGASVAYEVARRAPQQVLSLTLVSPGFCAHVPPGAQKVLEYFPAPLARLGMTRCGMRLIEPLRWEGWRMEDDELDAYIDPFKDVDRLEYALRLGADLLREAERGDAIAPVSHPTHLIFGARDNVVAVDQADAIADRLQATRLDIIPTSGHSPPEDCPAEFCDLLFDFLAHQ